MELIAKLVVVSVVVSSISADMSIGIDGEKCHPYATPCELHKRVEKLEIRLHSIVFDTLRLYQEDQRKLRQQVEYLSAKIDRFINRPDSLMYKDEPPNEAIADEVVHNLTSLMKKVSEEETVVKNLSEEMAALQEEKTQLKTDLESEKKLRRSLENQVNDIDEGLNETKAWKPIVENLQKKVESLTEPTQNLTIHVFHLIEEKDLIKTEIEKERNRRENLETYVYVLETEINKTKLLESDVDKLYGRMDELQTNITSGRIEEMLEEKLSQFGNNETILEKTFKKLEAKHNNVSTILSIDLNERVERLELSLISQNSTFNNLSSELTDLVEDLRYNLLLVNSSVITKQHQLEEVIMGIQTNHTLANENLTQLNTKQSELEVANVTIFASLQTLDAEISGLTDVIGSLYSDVNTTTTFMSELKLNLSELIKSLTMRDSEVEKLKDKLDSLSVDFINFQHELHSNLSIVYLKLRTTDQEMVKFSKHINRLQKLETALNKTASKEDLAQFGEKIVLLYVNMSRLKGQIEDMNKKYDNLTTKMTETKNWMVEYITREKKTLDKHINQMFDNFVQSVNRSITDSILEAKKEIKKMIEKHEKIINGLLNEPDNDLLKDNPWTSLSKLEELNSTTSTSKECSITTEVDPNLIISYKSKPLVSEIRSFQSGEELVFRCSHIGRYALIGQTKIYCDEGKWNNHPPTCKKLPDEEDIINTRLDNFNCSSGVAYYRFPFDCSKYISCMAKTVRLESCRGKMEFDSKDKRCIQRIFSDCDVKPAIGLNQDLGVPNHPMGISPEGIVFLYPGSYLSLDCVHPIEEDFVEWRVKTISTDVVKVYGGEIMGDKVNRFLLKNVTKDDTGSYSCARNDDRNNTINIIVKDIRCPEIKVEDPLHISNSNSSLKLSSKLQFLCQGDYTLEGASSITCLTNGQWSDSLPTCKLEGCLRPDTKNDSWIILSPDLPTYEPGAKIKLNCQTGAPVNSIPAVVRCVGGGVWNLPNFPNCSK